MDGSPQVEHEGVETRHARGRATHYTQNGGTATKTGQTYSANSTDGSGVLVSNSGTLTLSGAKIMTGGDSSSLGSSSFYGLNAGVVAASGSTISLSDSAVTSSGQDSPGIYSTGATAISDATITSTGAEAAVIEGANSITLKNTTLSSTKAGKWGVMIYQSMSGDAQGTRGTFTMTGGTLSDTASTGPLFYVTNSTRVISHKGVRVTAASGTLLKAAGGRSGTTGSNGGTAILTADGQTLAGNMIGDSLGTITNTLKNGSSLTGSINADHKVKAVALALDSTSTWTVTADSYLTSLTDTSGISGKTVTNIRGNGHTVYYDASNAALGGKTFTLAGGGYLKPTT